MGVSSFLYAKRQKNKNKKEMGLWEKKGGELGAAGPIRVLEIIRAIGRSSEHGAQSPGNTEHRARSSLALPCAEGNRV